MPAGFVCPIGVSHGSLSMISLAMADEKLVDSTASSISTLNVNSYKQVGLKLLRRLCLRYYAGLSRDLNMPMNYIIV